MVAPPIDIVCGFLGSGKTTLIRHVLEQGLDAHRVAVVMNEIGEIGIDGRLIEAVNVEKMVELNNGCICCTVNGQLGPAMEEILATAQPELIIIETTGVADVPPIMAGLAAVDLHADAIITVIDAENFPRISREEAVARRQVEMADFLVLNKIDTVTPRQDKAVRNLLRRLNDSADIFPTSWGAVPAGVLFGAGSLSGGHETVPDLEHGHLEAGSIGSFVYHQALPLIRPQFQKSVRQWPDNIYRCKGILWFDGEERARLFNFTCGRMHLEWLPWEPCDGDRRSSLVFIGKDLAAVRPWLLGKLDACGKKGLSRKRPGWVRALRGH